MHDSHPLLEDLVAVLLGEADEPTRERIEAALREDPRLGELQERLRATIDAAQTATAGGQEVTAVGQEVTAGGADVLSAQNRATLLASARSVSAAPVRSVGLPPLLRAAAAVVCLAGAVWVGLTEGPSGSRIEWVEDEPSALAAARARQLLLNEVQRLRARPFELSGAPDPGLVAAYRELAEEAQRTEVVEQELAGEMLGALGYGGGGGGRDDFFLGATDGLRAKGEGSYGARYGGRAEKKREASAGLSHGAPGGPAGGAFQAGASNAQLGLPADAPRAGGGGGGGGMSTAGPTAPGAPSTPAAGAAPAPATSAGGAAPAPSNQPARRSRGSGGGGSYRGAGDTVPPRPDASVQPAPTPAPEHLARAGELSDARANLERADEGGGRAMFWADESGRWYQGDALGGEGVRRSVRLPAFQDAVELRQREVLRGTTIGPGVDASSRFSTWWGDNPWELTLADAQATFAADVDTASFGRARYTLGKGRLPGRAEVRTEEFVNWFRADLEAPATDALALSTELAPSALHPGGDRWLLRVGVRAQDVAPSERDPLDLVLVIDRSGSMRSDDRMGLVKRAVGQLVEQLDARDTVSVVTFNAEAVELLPPTSAASRGMVRASLEPISPSGGTDAAKGLRLGYEVAARGLAPDRTSRVVLLSDGIANTGETDQAAILASVQEELDRGVHLNTIGVGLEQNGDAFLEQLADKGDGVCDYAQDDLTLQRALVERFAGAFVPVADDVKIQVEFAPDQVVRWRQLGYENRAIADADFRNDSVDAGEIGSGHQVTALFEVELARGLVFDGTPLATARLRWKEPKVGGVDNTQRVATERSALVLPYDAADSPRATSGGYRRAAVAARFAELLRRSVHARDDRAEDLVLAAEALLQDPQVGSDPDTEELVRLVRRAAELGLQPAQEESPVLRAQEELRMIEHLCHQIDSLPGGGGSTRTWELGAARREARERLQQALEWEETAAREAAGWSRNGTELWLGRGSETSPDGED